MKERPSVPLASVTTEKVPRLSCFSSSSHCSKRAYQHFVSLPFAAINVIKKIRMIKRFEMHNIVSFFCKFFKVD
jgi:hypothetical protein